MSKLKSDILKKKGVLVGIITGGVVVGLAFLGLGIVWYKKYKKRLNRPVTVQAPRSTFKPKKSKKKPLTEVDKKQEIERRKFLKFIKDNETVIFKRVNNGLFKDDNYYIIDDNKYYIEVEIMQENKNHHLLYFFDASDVEEGDVEEEDVKDVEEEYVKPFMRITYVITEDFSIVQSFDDDTNLFIIKNKNNNIITVTTKRPEKVIRVIEDPISFEVPR